MRHLFIILFVGLSSITVAQQPIERLFNSGEKAFQEKNYGLAVNYFSQCIAKDKNYMAAYWYRGLAYFYQNATQEALKDINKALSLSKSNDKYSQQTLYSIRAQIHSHTANYSDAINDYSKALSISPKDLGNLWGRALGYWNTGEYHKALKDFEECEKLIDINAKDDFIKLYSLMGRLHYDMGNNEKVVEYYTKSIDVKKESNLSYLDRAYFYHSIEEYNKAIADFTEALNIQGIDKKTEATILLYRGDSYRGISQYEKAIADFDATNLIEPNANAYATKSIVLRNIGKYKDALVEVNKAIEMSPESGFQVERGKLYYHLNDLKSSLDDYDKAIEIGDLVNAYTFLDRGRVKLKVFGLDRAKSDFEQAISMDLEVKRSGNCKHYALYFLGKGDEAIAFSLEVIKQFPTEANFYDLACIYSLMNQRINAIKYLQLAIDNGFIAYVHMAHDSDLDNIKYTKEFEFFLANNNIKVTLPNPISDISIQIPETNLNFNHRFALIVGNEDYSSYQIGLNKEINVDFARNDALAMKEYFTKVFGIPERNITLLTNATAAQIMQGLEKLSKLASVTGGKAEIFFYYAGHGIADQETRESYIIPVDVNATNLNFAIKLQDVYNKLTENPSQRVTVFLDACFSGGARNKELLGMRAVRVRPKENAIKGNLVIFASSSDTENSQPLHSQNHGLFTYYLLKKIKETKGSISYKELYDYVKENVSLEAILNNNLTQTPSVIVSPDVESHWTNWRISN